MKKLTIAVLTFFVLVTAGVPAVAATRPGMELSGALAYGTGPDDFDDAVGLNIGMGYMLRNIENLQGRIDISYFVFDQDFAGFNVEYTRIPINISGRYFFPMTDKLNLFAEAGVEASFDDAEFVNLAGGRGSESEVNLGFTPGGGVEYFLKQGVSLFALGRFHVISDDYFTLHVGGAYHF